MKYISHLDVNRCMQRAVKRAQLPVWYTQGFNPHLYLTFALPLSLGYESEYEVMDLRLTQPMACDAVMQRLNEALPEGFHVFRAAKPQEKTGQIARADYLIRLYGDDLQQLEETFSSFLGQSELLVEKKTKKGFKTVDLKPEILSFSLQRQPEWVALCITLPAGNHNLNPSLFLEAFAHQYPDRLTYGAVTRLAIQTKDGALFT